MSLHRSLKTKPAGLNQHRNVLTRAERIEQLADEDRFEFEEDSPMGLPKIANRKIKIKSKQKDIEGVEGEETERLEGAEVAEPTSEE